MKAVHTDIVAASPCDLISDKSSRQRPDGNQFLNTAHRLSILSPPVAGTVRNTYTLP
ncbi:MAG: hypothetical protein JRE16_07700 [Deltaproteobacteria bacterium]|nr:hypothetical protein [Deltaproteobacteria bacterium]MBW2504435.1 hypothetical protein [Deltaproteobacteria bacterium]